MISNPKIEWEKQEAYRRGKDDATHGVLFSEGKKFYRKPHQVAEYVKGYLSKQCSQNS